MIQEQVYRWIPLVIALAAGSIILLRTVQFSKDHRSPGQWLIFRLYKLVQIGWAIVRGIDVGYLEYRRVLHEAQIEIENERALGKLVRARTEEPVAP